jgi:hypothetical protein
MYRCITSPLTCGRIAVLLTDSTLMGKTQKLLQGNFSFYEVRRDTGLVLRKQPKKIDDGTRHRLQQCETDGYRLEIFIFTEHFGFLHYSRPTPYNAHGMLGLLDSFVTTEFFCQLYSSIRLSGRRTTGI